MRLQVALQVYRHRLNRLSLEEPVTQDAAITILETRSNLAAITQTCSPNLWQRWCLWWKDRHLQGWSDRIVETVDLASEQQRRSVSPSEWWWYLEPASDHWQLLDGPALFVSRMCLPISAAFVLNISSKFLGPGVDLWGALAIAVQSVVVFAAGGSVVTEGGQTLLKEWTMRLGWSERAWHELGAIASLGLVTVLLAIQLVGFPLISDLYN